MKIFLAVLATPVGFMNVDIKVTGGKPTIETIRQIEAQVKESSGYPVVLTNLIELES